MKMVTLAIVYERPDGPALRVAEIRNDLLILEAARIAIEEAELNARALAERDVTLGSIQQAEVDKLKEVLLLLLPALNRNTKSSALTM